MAGIAHQSNSWPSSEACDYAELNTAKTADSFDI
jgi:hypothetical protein